MTNKQHIVVIFVMVIVISLLWRLVVEVTKEETPMVEQRTTPYNIEIVNASYGLNCQYRMSREQSGGFVDPNQNRVRKNNALRAVSDACNGKEKCSVMVTDDLVGGQISQTCSYARLEVEYRCFSFDRPWATYGYNGSSLEIDCTKR